MGYYRYSAISTNLVTSVFGRQGAITAQADDYAASLITNDSSVTGAYVDDALNSLLSLVTSGVSYEGTWNASTNTPTLGNSGAGGDKGDYYVVSVAGSTSIDGITDWEIGDWIIHNGTVWQKVDNSESVVSVFGRDGAVTAQSGDYNADQIDDAATTNKFATAAELAQIATNTGNISTNAGNIATNTGNISTNAGNIATNTSNIATNTGNIATNTSNIADRVVGPGSSVDNTIPRFDSTTGKIIQGSSVVIDDSDNITGVNDLTVDNNLTVSGYITEPLAIGDPGLESGGVNVNGVTYNAALKVNDIGGTEPAQSVIHRHSTTLQALLLGTRSNSDTDTHGTVTNGMNLFEVIGGGWTGSHYDLFASIRFLADSGGTISSTSAPGTIDFRTSADGTQAPASAMTIRQDKSVEFKSTTASKVPYLDANKALVSSSVTPTELGYVSGVTSSIQTQINSKQNSSNAVTTDGAQDITGIKTFTVPITLEEQASTPSNPSSGDKKFYAKNDGKLYTLDSSGNEIEVGSGTGGGRLNLNINPNAEVAVDNSGTNDIGDYIDSGSGTTVSKTTTTTEIPLYPFKETAIEIALATGTSDYTRLRFQVPEAYRGAPLGIRWDQIVSSLSAQDIKVELYNYSDAYSTGETEVPLFFDDSSGDSFVPLGDFFSSSFNPDSSREYYELRWINNGATSGSLFMNEVEFFTQAPGIATFGGWKEYDETDVSITGTSSWATDFASLVPYKDPVSGGWRLRANVKGNSSSIGSITITIAGITFPAYNQAGSLSTNTTATANECYAIASTNTLKIEQGASRSSWWFSFDVKITGKPTWADFDNTVLTATEAQIQNSEMQAYSDSATAYTAGDAIVYEEVSTNPTGDTYNSSTGEYTVALDGTFNVHAGFQANAAVGSMSLRIAVNGTTVINGPVLTNYGFVGGEVKCTAGQVITVEISTNATNTADGTFNFLTISRIAKRSAQIPGFPFSDNADTTKKYLIPAIQESGEGNIGAITNWASPGSKKYRWTRVGNIIHFWWYVTATSGSASSSATTLQYDLPGDVPSPANHISNDASGEFPIPCSGAANTNNFVKNYIDNNAGTYRPSGAFNTSTAATYWSGYATWMINP